MADDLLGIHRPQRWDVPFGPEMTDADVDHILQQPPFNRIDAARFPAALSLRGLVRNDTRLHRYQRGDIIIRAGDYLSSAFFILAGTCRIEMAPAGAWLSDNLLGRGRQRRKSLFELVAQLWRNHRWREVRDPATYAPDPNIGRRGHDLETRIYLHDVQAVLDSQRTAALAPGQSFGETAALSRTPREYTVFAETDGELVEVRWQGLRDLMRRDEALRQHSEKTFRERALLAFLGNSPVFRGVAPEQMEALAREVIFDSYGAYDRVSSFREVAYSDFAARLEKEPIIAEQGEYVNGLYMVRNGLVRVSVRENAGHRTVSYLTPGQSYGFDELARWQGATKATMQHTLRAVGYVNVVLVPAPAVEKYVFDKPARGRVALPLAAPEAPRPAISTELIEFMVENRFINGTATMVMDLDRCTRCDDCVRACAATHDNNPRFLRHGPTYGHYMVANACMHCQDPVCMIECPTGAIHRDLAQGVVVVNDATCIGCSACANNCPYDAIRMVEIRDRRGHFIVDTNTNQPILKATKCDLCIDQRGGPACQRACPHDALKRVDMRDQKSFADWLNR